MKPNLLRAEFRKNGLTQEAVAKMLGITPKTLSVKLKKGVFGTDEAISTITNTNEPCRNAGFVCCSDCSTR